MIINNEVDKGWVERGEGRKGEKGDEFVSSENKIIFLILKKTYSISNKNHSLGVCPNPAESAFIRSLFPPQIFLPKTLILTSFHSLHHQ